MEKNKIFDEWLVLRYLSGDSDAIPLLVERWNKRIIIYINQMIRDNEASKDISQDCWIAIIKGLSKLRKPQNFGAWALSIAHRKAIDHIRNKSKSLEEYEKSLRLNEHSENNSKRSDSEKVKLAMEKLSPNHKNVLKLFYLEGFTLEEISKITHSAEGTIKSQLFYARNHLKKILKS